ncbi:MAG TPA: class I SAM-dependent methyltransferase [Kutzneria sp.]|nr:class I SAM-dependent methyltransferase [Kutzneria sp.]
MRPAEQTSPGVRQFRERAAAQRVEHYRRLFGPVTASVLPALAAAAGLGTGGRALDLGCGDGRLSTMLTGLGWFCVPADLSMSAMRSETGRLPVNAMVADAMALPVAAGAVELVAAAFLTPHLPDLHRGLAEMRRVLCQDGRVLLAGWSRPARSPFNGLLVELIRDGANSADRSALDESVRRADPEHVGTELTRAGFTEVRVDVVPTTARIASSEVWWDGLTRGSGGIAFLLQQRTPSDRQHIRRRFLDEAAKFGQGAAISVTAEAFVISATAS